MLKHPPEKLIELCDVIASGILSYNKACRAVGMSNRTFWHYIKRSQAGDEELLIEYLGEQMPFHRAVNSSRRVAMHEMRGLMEQKSIFGYDEPVFFQGMPTWKPDPRCVGLDEDVRELLGYPRDGLLRDENGCTIQNTIHHEPPIQLQLRIAEAFFPTEYRPGTNSTVNVSGSVNAVVGVAHVGKPQSERPVIPPAPVPPPLPELTVLSDADALAIPETDDAPEPEPEPEAAPEPMAAEPEAAPEPEPAKAPPVAAERSGRKLSELELDLISRSRASTPEQRSRPIGAT